MPRKALFSLLILLVLFPLGFGLYRRLTRPVWQAYRDDELKVGFDWPGDFQAISLTAEERESGMVFKIGRPEPEAQVFLRVEEDLGPVRFTGKTILEYLVETIDRTYPNRFPEFYKEDQRRFVLAGKNAEEFVFTYKSPGSETHIRQRYVVIVDDEANRAFFLSLQAPREIFSRSNDDFDRIVNSFSLF